MAKKHTLRSAWKQVLQQSKTAVFLFRHGIELLSLESESSHAQFDKMIKDYEIYLCGVYDASCSLAMFREDIEALSEQVALDPVVRKQLLK
jgi:glycine cleavage system regulatory protein